MNWAKHMYYHNTPVMVRFTPREIGPGGGELKPGLAEYIGAEIMVRALWRMNNADPYPGEYALGAVGRDGEVLPGIMWVASGDVTVIKEQQR